MSSTAPTKSKGKGKEVDYEHPLPERSNFPTFKDFLNMVILGCLDRLEETAKQSKVLEMKKLHKKWTTAIEAAETGAAAEAQLAVVEDLRTRMDIIKDINLSRLSHSLLYKRITKDSTLTSDKRLARVLAEDMPESKRDRDSIPIKEEIDVEARISSSQIWLAEMKASINLIHRALESEAANPNDEIDLPPKSKSVKKTRINGDSSVLEEEWGGIGGSGSSSSGSSSGSDAYAGSEALNPMDQDVLDESIYDESDEFFDDGWESGSVDSEGNVVSRPRNQPHASADDDTDSGDDMRISFDHDGNSASPPPAKRRKTGRTTSTSESVFLPSLSVGFMPGEADPKDDWENVDVEPEGLRRNRRGQRARRKLAELKYGSKAKHLLKRKEQDARSGKMVRGFLRGKKLDRKSKPRQPSIDKTHTVKEDDFFVGGHAKRPTSTGDPTNKPPAAASKMSKAEFDAKPVHPSWEAKQKLKQKEGQAIYAAQGKKIVFS